MTSGPFVSLHNHTELGSNLDSMNRVDEIFARAKEVDHPALAITDHGYLTAHYDCWKESKKTGVKFIPGLEAYFSADMDDKKTNHMVLLAQNAIGYKNILRLNYESFKNQVSGYMGKFSPRLGFSLLEQYSEGVFCLTACSNGLIAKALITDENEELALCYVDRLHKIFSDRFYLEIQPHALHAVGKTGKEVNQVKLNQAMIRISADCGIPYVITCDAHYKDKDHAKYHDFMLAVKDHKQVDDPDRFRYGVQDMYLKTHEEIEGFFGKDIAKIGMANSIKITDACEVPTYLEPTGPMLPKFPVEKEPNYSVFMDWKTKSCPNIDDDKAYLRYKCMEGFKQRFGDRSDQEKSEAWERTKKELNVLEEKNFSSYMLIVSDYMEWAKKMGNVCSPARGSAAGSMVAFLSNITEVNPLIYGLIFERFQNKQKKSFPDIDSDFADPVSVKNYLKEKYGEDRVVSISNWSTLSPKVIMKDVARSLNIGGDKSSAFQVANEINEIIPMAAESLEEIMEGSEKFTKYMQKYPELYEYGSKLQGLTKNMGIHAAGVIIGDRPLYEVIPLRIDAKTGVVSTQWEKERCEENGLIKMDLLGVKTLGVIDECLSLIEKNFGDKITLEEIPLDDQPTYQMISDGGTSGVFQLESSLTPLCRKIKPKNIEQISAINALGRPSCQPEVRETYINCALGLQEIDIKHPNLERALRTTNGILLYEESAMYIAQDCAGWDLNEADALRKISKLKGKDPELVLRTEAKFITDCMVHSKLSYEAASEIWNEYLANLGNYSFNKCLSGETLIRVAKNKSKDMAQGNYEMPDYAYENEYECKMLRDLTPVDEVFCVTKGGSINRTRVVEVIFAGTKNMSRYTFTDGSDVIATSNHKFLNSNHRFLTLKELNMNGSKLLSANYASNTEAIKILNIENDYTREDSFNLHVAADEHNYILGNGLISKNSHSISYSIISYYTAWLRKHYPTQFMCSILNFEDPNADSAQEYLTSCKKLGIEIVPPSLKDSSLNYTVEKDGVIITGLTAVKGAGETAIDNIMANRPYNSLADFFVKTEARVVNKRVVESLIKAGAFDCFGFTRKSIFDGYIKFRTKVTNKIKKIKTASELTDETFKREDWLDEISDGITFEYSDEEWDRKDLLLYEKEVLGRTISGQLHEIFGGFFKTGSPNVTPLNQIDQKAVKSKVKIEVIINNKIKEFLIKNGPNVGDKFAKYAIEDAYGNRSELTLWAGDYERYRDILVDGTPIKAICQVTEYLGQKSLALSTLERRM